MKHNNRLESVDGLRGIAILMVLIFHYFGEKALNQIYPFGGKFSSGPLSYGNMGVDLFFIVSGFVIALTLKRCRSPFEFLVRRFIRIWPALVVCSVFTFIIVSLSDSEFALIRKPELADFLPSLTLTPVAIWRPWFPHVDLISGVFWTLVVEGQFYVVAAILYWGVSANSFGRSLTIITIVNILLRAAIKKWAPDLTPIYSAFIITDFLPWFAAGSVFFELYNRDTSKTIALLLLTVLFLIIARASTLSHDDRLPIVTAALAFSFFLAFWIVATASRFTALLEIRSLVWIGRCSYSLYLFHYTVGMILISHISKFSGAPVQIILTCLIAAIAILVGQASFLVVESTSAPFLQRLLISKAPSSRLTTSAVND